MRKPSLNVKLLLLTKFDLTYAQQFIFFLHWQCCFLTGKLNIQALIASGIYNTSLTCAVKLQKSIRKVINFEKLIEINFFALSPAYVHGVEQLK